MTGSTTRTHAADAPHRDHTPPTDDVTLGGTLTPAQVVDIALGRRRATADMASIHDRLSRARAVVDHVLASGIPSYGVNRGLGPLRDVVIPDDELADFQRFVIMSHAAAIGEPLTRAEGRAAIAVRLNTMAAGRSGASVELFDALWDLLTHDVIPVIPAEGSVGAADLSQMAAIGMVLIGSGRAWLPGSDIIVPGGEALAAAGLRPLRLGPKDGLALVGSNALSTAMAALTLYRCELLAERVDLVAALTVEALSANLSPFDAAALAARPLHGQQASGQRIREALVGGDLAAGLIRSQSLQDPISLRTVPQVHGALLDVLENLDHIITVEISSAGDNPYLDLDRQAFTSNGNFSITGLAIGFDTLRIALAHVTLLAERRVAQLVKQFRQGVTLSQQIEQAKTNTGYITPVILAQTASSLVGRVKHSAMPVSLTGTIVGDGVEDHASMAYQAVRMTEEILKPVERIFSIEALLSATLIADHQRTRPRGLGKPVARLVETVDEIVARSETTSDIVAAVAEVLRRERRGDDLGEVARPAPIPEPVDAQEREASLHDQLQ